MRLFVDEKPVEILSSRQMREVHARRPNAERLEAVAIDLAEADRRATRGGRVFYGGVGGVVGLIIFALVVGILFGGGSSDNLLLLPFALIALVFCAWILRWGYRRSLRHWAAHSQARAVAAPPVGTAVVADSAGLTIGGVQAAWAALEVEALHFNRIALNEDTSYRVERLALSDGRRRFVIDRDFLSEGEAIARLAYVKLIVERGYEELRGEPADSRAA